ncbi:immunoglobulin-like domain-containing protein, partial [Furfurilactobacillus entadae]|uniref:immunoglobulin-like domain-containing protein n=1 Tax=Furfurilactobacillus entadae TaxID=2922307 RepID=UPI0038B2AADE
MNLSKHYKLYKDGKSLVNGVIISGTVMLGLITLSGNNARVHADTLSQTSNGSDNASVISNQNNQTVVSLNSNQNAKTTTDPQPNPINNNPQDSEVSASSTGAVAANSSSNSQEPERATQLTTSSDKTTETDDQINDQSSLPSLPQSEPISGNPVALTVNTASTDVKTATNQAEFLSNDPQASQAPVTVSNNFNNGPFNGDSLITVSGELNGPFKSGDSLTFTLPVNNVDVDNSPVTFNGAEAYGNFKYDNTTGIGSYTFDKDFPEIDTPIKFNLNWSAKSDASTGNKVSVTSTLGGQTTPLIFTNGRDFYDTLGPGQPGDQTYLTIAPTPGLYGIKGAGNDNYIGSGQFLPTGQMTFSVVINPGGGLSDAKDRTLTISPIDGGTLSPEDVYYSNNHGNFPANGASSYIPLDQMVKESNGAVSYTTGTNSITIKFADGYSSRWDIIAMILKNPTDLNKDQYRMNFVYATSSTNLPVWGSPASPGGKYQNNSSKGFVPNIQGNVDHNYYVGQVSQEQLSAQLLSGVTATDVEDGNLTSKIVLDDSSINVNTPGVYKVTYKVTDADGNIATVTSDITIKADQRSISANDFTMHVGDATPDAASFAASATDIDGK